MQLTYRGLTYDYRPPHVETGQEVLGLSGAYRGLDYRFRRTQAKNIIQPNVNLTYRGVTFNRANPSQPVVESTPTTNNDVRPGVAQRTRIGLSQKLGAAKKRQQSLLRRLAAEIGLSNERTSP